MTLITDYPERVVGSVDGTEEYLINLPGSPDTDMKILGSSITAAAVATHAAYVISNDAAVAALTTGKVSIAGDTMTGFLTLNSNPTSALHSATKQYVDGLIANKADAIGQSFDSTTAGITAADTNETTALATTDYTANKITYEILKKTVVNTATKVLVEADKGTILVTRTTTGTCAITLPAISGFVNNDRVEFYIIDAGPGAETYAITVTCAGSDTFLDGSTSYIIDTNGESLLIGVDSLGNWIIKDKVNSSSTTREGLSRTATNAEALALANTTAYVTPAELGNVFDQELYAFNEIGIAAKTFVEADTGAWYVTYTATGSVALTLPDATTLVNPTRFVLEIWDAGNAFVNNITISTAGGNIDGAASFGIQNTRAGLKIYCDGTNYFSVANTARATAAAIGLDTVNTLSGAGAIVLTDNRVDFTSTGVGQALTLANGVIGQELKIVHVVDGGSGILTPTTLLGYTTITFNDVGDSVELQFGTGGWAIISVFNATIA